MTDDFHHLAAAYALDALEADERRAFEEHYPACEICAQEVVEFRATASALAEHTSAVPSDEIKKRVMSQVSKTRQIAPLVEALGPETPTSVTSGPETQNNLSQVRSFRSRAAIMLASAAALILVISGLIVVRGDDSSTDNLASVLDSSDAVVTGLEGEIGTLQVVWSAGQDGVAILGSGLDSVDVGSTYELWLLTDEGAVPAGLFNPSDDGDVRTFLKIKDIDVTGWAVSVEPDGGSDQPTTDPVYSGTI